MHHGTVFGAGNKKLIPNSNPVMHCQCRYPQVFSATSDPILTMFCLLIVSRLVCRSPFSVLKEKKKNFGNPNQYV